MAYTFVSTHGVEFAESTRTRRADGGFDETYEVWAKFVHDDESSNLVNGVTVKRYRFDTTDTKIAARLRKVDDYGITEVKPEKSDASTAPAADDSK